MLTRHLEASFYGDVAFFINRAVVRPLVAKIDSDSCDSGVKRSSRIREKYLRTTTSPRSSRPTG
jgi:hypothetical protein